MAVPFKPVAVRLPPRVTPAQRTVRKIALLGSHAASLRWCPWRDPSWELWGHAASRQWYQCEPDRYFDLHGEGCWSSEGKVDSGYVNWLRANTVPIYMQRRHPEIPASRRYPKERILMEYGGARRYFKNQMAWMVALAFSEGVTHLGLFGINYGHETEYEIQRGSAEYWLGRAEERGVHLVLPDECTLLAEPAGLYGYDSHDEIGQRLPHWHRRKPKPEETIRPVWPGDAKRAVAKPPDWLVPLIEEDMARRPEWAKPSFGGNGGIAAEEKR